MRTLVAWLVTRALMVWYFLTHPTSHGDVYYYQQGNLPEYPDPSTWPLAIIGWFGEHYLLAFMGFVLLCDAAFTYLLRRNGWAVAFWLVFAGLLAPVYLARLDVIPALLVGVAAASPAWTFAVGLAAAAKLWPAALIPALGWRKGGWAIAAAAALVAVTVALHGWDRVISPLTYQRDRGLQVETLLATPFMWSDGYHIEYAASKSYEITGPGVAEALTASTVLMVVAGVAVLAICAVLATRQYDHATTLSVWLLTIMLIIITAKVFSPQYMLWIGPVFAMMLVHGEHRPATRLNAAIGGLLVLAALTTTLVYPVNYDAFLLGQSTWALVFFTVRNAALVVITVLAAWQVARRLARNGVISRRSDRVRA